MCRKRADEKKGHTHPRCSESMRQSLFVNTALASPSSSLFVATIAHKNHAPTIQAVQGRYDFQCTIYSYQSSGSAAGSTDAATT